MQPFQSTFDLERRTQPMCRGLMLEVEPIRRGREQLARQ